MPGHHQPATYTGWHVFSREDRYSDLLETHPNTKKHTTSRKLTPLLRQAHTEGRQQGEDSSDKDSPTTAAKLIDRIFRS
jgi:hypothetical protein